MSTDVTFQLAQKVSSLGNKQHMTLKSLSEKSDVSTSTIRAILNTRIKARNPKLSTIEKLAHAFKQPLNQFMDFAHKTK